MMIVVEEPRCLIHAPNENVHPGELERIALAEALFLRSYRTPDPGVCAAPPDGAVPFLVQLAEARTQAGEPEGLVQPRVAQMAAAYRVPAARVVVLLKLTLAAAGLGEPVALDDTPPTEPDLWLDQVAAVARVARLADSASVDPADGMRALDAAEALPHASGRRGSSEGTPRSRSAHA